MLLPFGVKLTVAEMQIVQARLRGSIILNGMTQRNCMNSVRRFCQLDSNKGNSRWMYIGVENAVTSIIYQRHTARAFRSSFSLNGKYRKHPRYHWNLSALSMVLHFSHPYCHNANPNVSETKEK